MLLCDTSHVIGRYYDIDSSLHLRKVVEDYGFPDNKILFWQIGYEVREPIDFNVSYINGTRFTNGNEYTLFNHIEYLDADKTPLSKSIIVWQSKSL